MRGDDLFGYFKTVIDVANVADPDLVSQAGGDFYRSVAGGQEVLLRGEVAHGSAAQRRKAVGVHEYVDGAFLHQWRQQGFRRRGRFLFGDEDVAVDDLVGQRLLLEDLVEESLQADVFHLDGDRPRHGQSSGFVHENVVGLRLHGGKYFFQRNVLSVEIDVLGKAFCGNLQEGDGKEEEC